MIAMHWLSKVMKLLSRFAKSKKFRNSERRIQRKKKMPGEHAEDLGLSAVEEIKRCSLQTMDRFRCEAEKRFNEICMLNGVFGFLNSHALLRNENIEDINKFKNIYADDVNFSELTYEIARFKRLVQSSGTVFQRVLDVLCWMCCSG